MEFPWHLYLMALIYVLAGLNHFRNPKMYLRIIPDYLPRPILLNSLSGIAEIGFGLLLLTPYSAFAAWGIIALLIAIFPANLFMLSSKKASFGLPRWVLIARLPLQLLLIFWAYAYT